MKYTNRERAEKVSKIFHSQGGLTDSRGVDVGALGDMVVHGEDNRKDYFATTDARRRLADSTVILTNKDALTKQPDGSYKLDVQPFREVRTGMKLCGGQRFANQHTGGWGSGFVAGSDVIVTAGHCAESLEIVRNTAFVFGFRADNANHRGTTSFPAKCVYFGKELIDQETSSTSDFAIVRVNRPIDAPNAAPLPIRETGSVGVGQNVGVIGYPSGFPVKIAFGDETVVVSRSGALLHTNLDSFVGNSGSPVFNTDGVVEGILVRGGADFDFDHGNSCVRVKEARRQGSELVNKSSVFVNRIP